MSARYRRCARVVAIALAVLFAASGCQGDGSLFGWIVQQDQPKPATTAP